jgi:hypothetical protein
MNWAVRDGLPAPEGVRRWREAERQERNAEETLMAIVDSIARVAYPVELKAFAPEKGGWTAGPVQIPELETRHGFALLLQRLVGYSGAWTASPNFFVMMVDAPILSMLSRLSLRKMELMGRSVYNIDLSGTNLNGARLDGTTFVYSNFSHASMKKTDMQFARIENCTFDEVDLSDVLFENLYFVGNHAQNTKFSKRFKRSINSNTRRAARKID